MPLVLSVNNCVATELSNIIFIYRLLMYTHYTELLTYSWNSTLQVTSVQAVNQLLCILSSNLLCSSDVDHGLLITVYI